MTRVDPILFTTCLARRLTSKQAGELINVCSTLLYLSYVLSHYLFIFSYDVDQLVLPVKPIYLLCFSFSACNEGRIYVLNILKRLLVGSRVQIY